MDLLTANYGSQISDLKHAHNKRLEYLPLRSSFGAIEDWNIMAMLSIYDLKVAVVLRGDRGLEQLLEHIG